MKSLEQYSIPIAGMNLGIYKYEFCIDGSFFNHFENSPIDDGSFNVQAIFDKRPSLIILDFNIKGHMNTGCDRCLQLISLPMKSSFQVLIKYSEEPGEDAEVLYIPQDTPSINIADYIFEFIVLTIPIAKVYDCEDDPNAPCDKETLKYLNQSDEPSNDNPIWEELKNLENNSKQDPIGS